MCFDVDYSDQLDSWRSKHLFGLDFEYILQTFHNIVMCPAVCREGPIEREFTGEYGLQMVEYGLWNALFGPVKGSIR